MSALWHVIVAGFAAIGFVTLAVITLAFLLGEDKKD